MEPNWEELLLKLTAYAHQLLKYIYWFRGKGPDSFLKGKQSEDYAIEAIEKYLINPEQHDPSKSSLEYYLKKYVVRRAIYNDAKAPENKVTVNLRTQFREDGDNEEFLEMLLPHAEAFFDDQIDQDDIFDYIAKSVSNDDLLSKIFQSRCRDGLKRVDILEVHGLSESEYDNANKRLKRIIAACAEKFNLDKPKKSKKVND